MVGSKTFEEEYFRTPDDIDSATAWLAGTERGYDLYYCCQVLAKPKRLRENVLSCNCAWADLDSCDPSNMLVPPSCIVESSPNKFQAYWLFEDIVEPSDAEDISRRIAYYHAAEGADRSGWDLSQQLRVPGSYNYKYGIPPPIIQIRKAQNIRYNLADFDKYPQTEGYEHLDIPFPDKFPKEDSDGILQRFRTKFHPNTWTLYQEKPDEGKWSQKLWALEMYCLEAGMTREETFLVSKGAACNKYDRDGRSDRLLWKDVCRAWSKVLEKSKTVAFSHYDPPQEPMLTDEEREWVQTNPSLVEQYITWARALGDAAWQYHQAGAFVILSSLLAGSVRLPTSYGTMVPNLWFMILADTTLTRKTTAMDLSVDLLTEIDPDIVLATDGSIEGLMTSLSMRPGRSSLFLRDEFSGLMDAMAHKDYMAGMAETLTKLYDGKFQKRVLRKEIIEVRDPILILFAGGIKGRIMDLLTFEQVASGFMPRFVVISAEADVSKLRPLGPPSEKSLADRSVLIDEFTRIKKHYDQQIMITVGGKALPRQKIWNASMTPEAWALYNKFETNSLSVSARAGRKDLLTPTVDRLCKSGLKCSLILAAIRQMNDSILIEEEDVLRAFFYVEQWRGYSIELIANIGKSQQEKAIEQIERAIQRSPSVLRSTLMQYYHLTAKDTDMILGTLEQRGVIVRVKDGRSERLYPADQLETT